MKLLSIYRNDEGIVLERRNEFGYNFKSVFETVEAMLEHLDVYKSTGKIDEYKLEVSKEFWSTVIRFLNTGDLPDKEEVKIGRPSLGVTKKVSITLPEEYWDMLEILQEETASASRSEILRKILMVVLDNEVKSQMQRKKR